MASIIATSIDLTKIPKDKIIPGKKGKYLPMVRKVNTYLSLLQSTMKQISLEIKVL